MMTKTRPFVVAVIALAAISFARPALAGAPLICFPFDIHGARSLPFGTNGFHDVDRSYDVSKLVDDTLALLVPETPVIVRMETMRRATLYAESKPAVAAALLARLEDRARTATPAAAALADFDLGYLIETYRQASATLRNLPVVAGHDGYQLVLKASALRPDPQIAYAAGLIDHSVAPRAAGR
jgi:hypothetical protein